MQAPKTRNNPSDMAHKTSTTTPRVARQLKITGDTNSACSSNSATRTPTERSPKVTGRSPRSPMSEKKRPSRAAEHESQISQLQEDLKKVKDQLSLSEFSRKKLQQEADETKKELATITAKLDESQHQLIELSASEEAHVLELQKISQEKDHAWQCELKATQNQNSVDSAALVGANVEIQQLKHELALAAERSKHDEDARAELQALKHDLSQTLSLVDDLSDLLKQCRNSEAQAHALAIETLQNLQTGNSTIETLKSEGLQYQESLNSVNLQLLDAQSMIASLEAHASNLRSDLLQVGGKSLLELECQLNVEIDTVKQEVEQLRYAIEETAARLHEAEIESMMKIQTAHEAVETMTIESSSFLARETEMVSTMKTMESDLKKLWKQVSELQANLTDKETELQIVMEENEGLKANGEKKEQGESMVDISNVLADAEAAKAREHEALLKLDAATAEKEKSAWKAARLAEQLQVAQASNAAMESELKRLRVQTEQWKKAADAAAAVLATAPNGKTVERTGSMDSSAYSNIRVGSPFYDDMDENSPRKKNALKRIGELWKKKSQNK